MSQFIIDNYFPSIAPIRNDYFAQKIGMAERDARLQGYRAILDEYVRTRDKTINPHLYLSKDKR